jgi:hypothetical protein
MARAFLSATSEAGRLARLGTQKSIANPAETKTFATQTAYRVGHEHKKAQEKAWALHRPNGLNGVKAS